ncbi:Homeobox protein HD-1 [Stylosanthes scabra]|uniref:Homeobox protein HD-1 n=1 Tax=Stylosanthes scabra TaxID=79078 RepID=A0ABU6RFW3_9FABA|nr:Homeobox protein HD-1 [Stylosanthes scabra]
MEITYSDSTTRKFSPLVDKLNEDNYITWKHLAILTVESLRMEDHLDPSKIPPQFTEDPTKKTPTENEAYRIWKDQDLTLTTWLVASMSETFKHKVVPYKQFYQVWDKIEEYFTAATSARAESLRAQLKSIKKTGTATEYLAKIRKVVDSLLATGYDVREHDHLHAIIDGLSEDYAVYIHGIVTRMGSIRVPEAESYLLAFEDMTDRFKNPNLATPVAHLDQSFNFRGSSRGGRNTNRGGGRFNFNNPRPQCQLCGRTGHVVWNCYHRFDAGFQPNQIGNNAQLTIPYGNSQPPPPSTTFHQPRAYISTPSSVCEASWFNFIAFYVAFLNCFSWLE